MNPSKVKKEFQKLYVDLIPITAWRVNLRSELKVSEWDAIRRYIYRQYGYTCAACGGKGTKHNRPEVKWPVECHERFSYDIKGKVQKFEGMVALCPDCHEATHFGLAKEKRNEGRAFRQLMLINNWGIEETTKHLTSAFSLWQECSKIDWSLDLRYLLINFKEMLGDESIEKIEQKLRC